MFSLLALFVAGLLHSTDAFAPPLHVVATSSRRVKQARCTASFDGSLITSRLQRTSPLHPSSTVVGSTATAPATTTQPTEDTYDWRNQWYALTFSSYIPNPSDSAEAVPAAVFGEPLVLWRSCDNDDTSIHCAVDVCPHRAAALSEGRVRDGMIECLYHGWQFHGDDGSCARIPQLEPKAEIPKRACLQMKECRVVEGIVWAWMGKGKADTDPPMQNDLLDPVTGKADGVYVNDFQIDLPYDHSFLAENLIDPAHIPISHDKTQGGGKRENAQAYEMIVDEDSVSEKGFTGRFRFAAAAAKDGPWTELKFDAPGIIRQTGNPRGNILFGAALHCMPLALGRSRLLFRVYIGGLPWFARTLLALRPKAFSALNSCKVLEQDVGLITTQEDHFARNPGTSLGDDFLLLGSSDVFVGQYRRWLDRVGHGMPWFQGLATKSSSSSAAAAGRATNALAPNDHLTGTELPPALDPATHRASAHVETRYHRHVMHCPDTRQMLRRVQVLKRVCITLGIAAAASVAGLAATPSLLSRFPPVLVRLAASSVPVSALGSFALQRVERAFYVSFQRRNQLRTESGLDV